MFFPPILAHLSRVSTCARARISEMMSCRDGEAEAAGFPAGFVRLLRRHRPSVVDMQEAALKKRRPRSSSKHVLLNPPKLPRCASFRSDCVEECVTGAQCRACARGGCAVVVWVVVRVVVWVVV